MTMEIDAVQFLCDAVHCKATHVEPMFTSADQIDAYLGLVKAGWRVVRIPTRRREHYCPEHYKRADS